MYLGDNFIVRGIASLVDELRAGRPDAQIMQTQVPDPRQFGVAELSRRLRRDRRPADIRVRRLRVLRGCRPAVRRDPARVRPATTSAFPRRARPAYSVLGHDGWSVTGIEALGDWRHSLRQALPGMLPPVDPRARQATSATSERAHQS